jgi:gamma-glutamyl hercynylcysteine S-oxide synthase
LPPSSPLASPVYGPLWRGADAAHLSLALIDARNRSLALADRLLAQHSKQRAVTANEQEEGWPVWALLGQLGWFQERWIARNTQRQLGLQCPAQPTLLASIDPRADGWFDPRLGPLPQRWAEGSPDLARIKAYLLETLETTLELLERASPSDDGLYFFRLALAYEDRAAEEFAVMAQAQGLDLGLPAMPLAALRAPLWVPATRWQQGAAPGGFAWDNERPQHELRLPEFEIDAQAVSWAQYAEFVDDGGYDNPAHWSDAGLSWLQAQQGRRAPRYVEQMGRASEAVLQSRFGKIQRVAAQASVAHVCWFEAQAFARWAGRRLPTEPEWELAASKLQGQGFRWGEVWEWSLNSFRAYPGFQAGPWQDASLPHFEHAKVLRGASWLSSDRMRVPSYRAFALPSSDHGFFGFRTCAF